MADTIRTLSQIQSLFADNTSGDITPQDLRDMLVSIFGVYGSILVKDGSTAQTGIGVVAVKLTAFSANGQSNGVTADHTNDRITIITDGIYLVASQVSFNGSINTTFDIAINVNQTEGNTKLQRKLGTGGDVGSGSLLCLESLSANDQVELFIEADGIEKEITVTNGQLVLLKIA